MLIVCFEFQRSSSLPSPSHVFLSFDIKSWITVDQPQQIELKKSQPFWICWNPGKKFGCKTQNIKPCDSLCMFRYVWICSTYCYIVLLYSPHFQITSFAHGRCIPAPGDMSPYISESQPNKNGKVTPLKFNMVAEKKMSGPFLVC